MATPRAASPDWLNVHQASAELNITPRAVRHRIAAGTITATKIGTGRTSAYVISRTEVERVRADDTTKAAS